MRIFPLIVLLPLLAAASFAGEASITDIDYVIVIYQENWSFDGLYSRFPGANGMKPGTTVPQVDVHNNQAPLAAIPQPLDEGAVDKNFKTFPRPVETYDLSDFVKPEMKTGDLAHRFLTHQAQINGGKLDRFVTLSDNPGLVLSQFDATNMPEGKLAQEFVLCDNFFQAAFGGSFLNHQWLIAAQTPTFKEAPPHMVQKPTGNKVNGNDGFDANGNPHPVKKAVGASYSTRNDDKTVTTDFYAVNTIYSVNSPRPPGADPKTLLPKQTHRHIGDLLDEKKINWAWYAGGWDDALKGRVEEEKFQYHHQPFIYFENCADDKIEYRKQHLRDEEAFFAELKGKDLPQVIFIKPVGINNEHPKTTDILRGQEHVAKLVKAVRDSAYWNKCAIIITYDEFGGRFDHVPPPNGLDVSDRWGPGSRVPAIIISPLAKKGYVDHTQYDTTSILKFIEKRFGLPNLSTRDAAVNSLDNAFNFAGAK